MKNSNINIFISHSSKDSDIIDEFIDDILTLSLNLSSDKIAYTSREDMGVPPGGRIDDYLRKNIKCAKIVLLMISVNYKKSEVCLNEMGAAWAYNRIIIPIILPNTDFSKLGWLLSFDKAIKIDDTSGLDSLYDRIKGILRIQKCKTANWNRNKQKFIDYCKNNSSPLTIPSVEKRIVMTDVSKVKLAAFDESFIVRGITEGKYHFQITIRLRAVSENISIKKIELCNNAAFTGHVGKEKNFLTLKYFIPMNILSMEEIDTKEYEKVVNNTYKIQRIKVEDFIIEKETQVSISFNGDIQTIRQCDGYDDLQRNNWALHIFYNINDKLIVPLKMKIINGTYNAYWG